MAMHSQIAGNRVEITARTLASTLRISEFRLESDSAHLLLLSAGEAEIIQGEKTLPVPAPGLVWLPIGPAGRLRLTAGSRGSLLRTSEIGLAHAMPTGTSASAVRNILQRVLTQAPAEKDRQELAGYLETIARENVRATTGSDTIIASLLSVTLIRICQHAIADIAAAVSTPGSLTERFVLLDQPAQRSVTCTGLQERLQDDGRLEVVANVKNRENRRIQVQVNCVFKDEQGFSTGDETPFQTLILAENSTEAVRFTAMNTLARKYTVRVRQAR